MLLRGKTALWTAAWAALCALPFGVFPPLIALLPTQGAMKAALWLLVWPACPALAIAAGFFTARRGVPAAIAWLIAPLGYMLLPLWNIRPEWPMLLAACVLGLVAAVAAEQLHAGKGKRR